MSEDNHTKTYYPKPGDNKVISIDSRRHENIFNQVYNDLEVNSEEINRVAEILTDNTQKQPIQGDGITMSDQNDYVTHQDLDRELKNIDEKNELRYKDLSHKIDSSKDLMISKIDSLSGKFDTIQNNMNDKFNNMKWTIGIIVTLFGIIISLIVKYG